MRIDLNDKENTSRTSVWPDRTRRKLGPFRSQTRTVQSNAPEATKRPSGDIAKAVTEDECPVRTTSSSPDVMSHIRIVVSNEPVKTYMPLG